MRKGSAFCCAVVLLVAQHSVALAQRASSPDGLEATGNTVAVYTARAAFEADCGSGLPVETFEEANVAPGESAVFLGPLRAATDNDLFGRRDILFDMQVDADSAGLSRALFVSGAGFAEASSVQVGNRSPTHNLDLEFGPAVTCAGFDVALKRAGATTTIAAFHEPGTALGSISISGFGSQFVGFRASVPRTIHRIRIATAAASERAEVDNIAFGNEGGFNVVLNGRDAPTTVAPGDSVRLKYTVTNQTPSALRGGLFFYAERDGVTVVRGPVFKGTFPIGQMSKVYTQPVPRVAPPGAYDYFICAGSNADTPIECSSRMAVTVRADVGR